MTEGSIISIGVKWLMAPDCSQVSEKKSFSLGSELCDHHEHYYLHCRSAYKD